MTPSVISPFFMKYMAAWVSFCVAAAILVVKDKNRLFPEWRSYWGFLIVPWKLCLFGIAIAFVTFAGRFTNDESWDWVTGSGMSVLTFLTAPWSVGIIYQVLIGRRPFRYLIIAIALLLFSSSWFYDAYLLIRDGAYTRRWAGNLMLSPIIYLAAGILWNLEAKEDRDFSDQEGIRLSFVRMDWPSRPIDTRFEPLILVSIPLIVAAAFVIVAFVDWNYSIFGK
ncbi:MAG: hypothetical protein ACLPV8_27795 [Steroidobacteraceae bacterium]|jgi:hypothetical protein